MTSGSFSSPAMTSAGSPGSSCCSPKISTDTKNSVGRSWTSRLAKRLSIEPSSRLKPSEEPRSRSGRRAKAARDPGSALRAVRDDVRRRGSLQLDADQAHEAVGHLLVALELRRVRDDDEAVVDVDDRALAQHLGGHLLVEALALLVVVLGARLLEAGVDLRVGIAPVVLRRIRLLEDVDVAVRIGAPRPGEHVGL